MTEMQGKMPEFDRSQFPDIVSCHIMPQTEEGIIEVEVHDAEGSSPIIKVPLAAVRKTNIPLVIERMREFGMPKEAIKPLEDHIAAGLLSCRVTERLHEENLIRIDLPSIEGVTSLVVDEGTVGKKR